MQKHHEHLSGGGCPREVESDVSRSGSIAPQVQVASRARHLASVIGYPWRVGHPAAGRYDAKSRQGVP
ncbi:MAG: hypothetical protein EB027_04420 [Actinobacteria bacterium]|nr:hypothetical protein [Actinomycetota bacterium]